MRARQFRLLVFGAALHGLSAVAQRSPFNGLEVLPADRSGHYRILIGGHFHGESSNRSGYPASTLLANLDTINSLGAHLLLSTGDLYMDAKKDSARYARALFSKLKVPFYNAPGNHDGAGALGSVLLASEFGYQDTVPAGHDALVQHVHAFSVLILNTEHADGKLDEQALAQLEGLGEHERNAVFIVSHRPIWAEDDPLYTDLFKDNTRSLTGTNFQSEVYPIIQQIAKHAHVYWISGSLGGQAPSSIFFQRHAPNITYIQCAIRDEPRDALLIADVYPDSVKWSALSLTGQQLEAPETYDAAWWRERVGKEEAFNWRLLPYLVKKTVTRSEFWWGAASGIILLLLVRRWYRR